MGVAILSALNAWAVERQTYFDPSVLPESFGWEVVRFDYYAATSTSEQILVRTQDVTVIWDPTYVNAHGSYGKLTLKNFYNHDHLYDACDLVFDNENKNPRGNCNFEWNEDFTKCQFSLTPYYFSEASSVSGVPTWCSSSRSALLALAKYDSGSDYWLVPDYVPAGTTKSKYIYGNNTPLTFEIDIINKTLTIVNNSAWGVFMRKTQSSGSSYVLEAFAHSSFEVKPPTTLAWIEENGVANAAYTVADQLVGVYAQGGSLWCKDQGNISIEKSENPGCIDYVKRLMGSVHGMNPSLEWDQSNWVELDFGDVTADRALQIQQTYVGHTIAAGTITGTYADNLNHRIVVNADPEVDGVADYVPNYYCPVNFMDETVVTTDNNSYYFLNPKTQEYAMLTMAMWKGGDVFVIPAKDETQGVNTADFSGAFTVNWDLNAIPEAEIKPLLSTDEVYEFHAILRRNLVETGQDGTLNVNRVIGKDVTPIDKYLVFPIDLTANNTITGINDVKTESQPTGDGFYYNLAGQRVTNPTPGFYIHNGKKVIIR